MQYLELAEVDFSDKRWHLDTVRIFAQIGYTCARAGIPYRQPRILTDAAKKSELVLLPITSREEGAMFKLFWPADLDEDVVTGSTQL